MKEVMAFIRQNKVNVTKDALATAGIPAFTCRRVLGRGKMLTDLSVIYPLMQSEELPSAPIGENLTEIMHFIPKRVFTMIVDDADVKKAVEVIMEANSTGNAGDGKIFVLPISENYNIRNGELTNETY